MGMEGEEMRMEEEELLRAKAIASMSKPKPSPNVNSKEEGELSSSSTRDDDDEHQHHQVKHQEMPTSTATCSASVAPRLMTEPINVAPVRKQTQGSSTGTLAGRGCLNMQLPTSMPRNQSKHLEMNPVHSKPSTRHTHGWYNHSKSNDNLVIRFSDDDSESDGEEHKERTSGRSDTKNRLNRHKEPVMSSLGKAKILQQPRSKQIVPRSKQMGTVPKKVSLSRSFVSSVKQIPGSSFRGTSAFSAVQDSPIQRHELNRALTSQQGGYVQAVNTTDTELENLRQQIAKRESELKIHLKSVSQMKERLPGSNGDYHGLKLDTKVARMRRSASVDAIRSIPVDREKKRLKLDEHSHSNLNSDGQIQMPRPATESDSEFKEQVLENSCCIEDQNPMSCIQHVKAVPIGTSHPSSNKQPVQGDEVDPVPCGNLLSEAVHGESSVSFVETILSTLPAAMVPPKQWSCLSGADMLACRSRSGKSPQVMDSLLNRTSKLENMASNAEDGNARTLKLPSPKKSASVHDGSVLDYLNQTNDVGQTSSHFQSLLKIEELLDKELEEAQELRHRCELEERRAQRAYRSAQRALFDANEKCNYLYRRRELLSVQLRAFMMDDSSSFWSLGWHLDGKTERDSIKNVSQCNLDQMVHESNVQRTDDAPLNAFIQNMRGHDLGADLCSEPDASTSELLHHRNNGAANALLSPSNHLNVSGDEDEEMFPADDKAVQSCLMCENKKEKLDRTVDVNESERDFSENAQDSALLEASLRSKLCKRFGTRIPSKTSSLYLNKEHNDKGASMDAENKEVANATAGKLSLLPDLPLSEAEHVQMDDTEGLEMPGSRNFQVHIHDLDQSFCDKFNSDSGYCQSTEPAESSSLKESFRPTSVSVFSLSSLLKSVFKHLKLLMPENYKVIQSSKDGKEVLTRILHEKAVNSYETLINVVGTHSAQNCIGETSKGKLDSCNPTIDPFWPHCMFELRGKCNNDECTWQHGRDYSKNTRMLSGSAHSEDQKIADAHGLQHGSRSYILPIPTYRIDNKLIKADGHSYGCVLARCMCQYWERGFCTYFAVPFSIQRILPPDVPSLYAGDGCAEDCDSASRLSLYFPNPDGTMRHDRQGLAEFEQSLELAIDLFYMNVKQEGKKKALDVLYRAIVVNPTSIVAWIIFLHIYYRKEKLIGKEDMFHQAIQHNKGSYELWLMYINSRVQNGDRLGAYDAALLTFCHLPCAVQKESIYGSACILDLFLQMVDFLCMSGDVEKIILRIYSLLSPAQDFGMPRQFSLLDILRCLMISDKCVFWVCCAYLVIYKKLPEAVVQRLEFRQVLPFELEWPSVELKDNEKHQALELMNLAVEMVTQEIRDEPHETDPSKKTSLRPAHALAVNHVRCQAALEGIGSVKNLFVDYMKVYPTCIELVLMSARLQKDLGGDVCFEGFEEALCCWPNDTPGVQCIWNQYAEYALENGKVDLTKKLMLHWFESFWKGKDPENRKQSSGKNDFHSDCKDELFGLLNLSLHRLLENDVDEARLIIDKALKLASAENLNHCIKEHVAFLLFYGTDLTKETPLTKVPDLLVSYFVDVQSFPISEPLSRIFFRSIKKPRVRRLIDKMIGPVSLDCSLMNSILKELYGPTLLPENFGKLSDLVDLVEALMDIFPANYQLAMSVYKLMVQTSTLAGVASTNVLFWAGSLLVNSIFQVFPVAPERIWLEAADLLDDLRMWDISERFHQQSVLVYPFSLKLWRSYYNLSKKFGNANAIVEAANGRGVKLD